MVDAPKHPHAFFVPGVGAPFSFLRLVQQGCQLLARHGNASANLLRIGCWGKPEVGRERLSEPSLPLFFRPFRKGHQHPKGRRSGHGVGREINHIFTSFRNRLHVPGAHLFSLVVVPAAETKKPFRLLQTSTVVHGADETGPPNETAATLGNARLLPHTFGLRLPRFLWATKEP